MKDGLVSARDLGVPDLERWLRIERIPGRECLVQFYDLALEKGEQLFFQMQFDLQFLAMTVTGATTQLMDGLCACSFHPSEENIEIHFRPPCWPFADCWEVDREEFLEAIAAVL